MYGLCQYAFCFFGRNPGRFYLGATHPYAGFYGYRQQPDDVIQLDLPCRPCSVFGEKACCRGDWACMAQISPDRIIEKVLSSLDSKQKQVINYMIIKDGIKAGL